MQLCRTRNTYLCVYSLSSDEITRRHLPGYGGLSVLRYLPNRITPPPLAPLLCELGRVVAPLGGSIRPCGRPSWWEPELT